MEQNNIKSGVLLALALVSGHAFAEHIVYGLDGVKAMRGNASGPYYVQLGSFVDKDNAYRFLHAQEKQWGKRAIIRIRAKSYSVGIGPLQSAAEVRALVGMHEAMPVRERPAPALVRHNKPVKMAEPQALMTKQVILDKDGLPEPVADSANWYAGVEGGVQQPEITNPMYINNGSGFAFPFNTDAYSTDEKETGFVGVSVGRRWTQQRTWLPAYSLGLRYNYLFPMNAGRQVAQYNLPSFTNYNYNWKLSSNVFLASAKLNFFQSAGFLPYVQAGAGIAANRTGTYNETPLPGVTPRISPAFASKTKTEFAYNVGAGLDYIIRPRFILSAGYEYKNLGRFNSGNGLGDWTLQSLNLGTYQTNGLVLGASYLLDR